MQGRARWWELHGWGGRRPPGNDEGERQAGAAATEKNPRAEERINGERGGVGIGKLGYFCFVFFLPKQYIYPQF
jgi:hypothetical protein